MAEIRRRLAAACAAILALLAMPGGAVADTLADLRARGVLIVGVKADYPPWGMRDAAGDLQGMEIDLARDLAARIGVPLRLVAVQTADRMEKLRNGQVDAVIATMGDSAARRAVIGLVTPHYYASGVSLLAPSGAGIAAWEDLAGRPVCAKHGSYFNSPIAQRYGLDLLVFRETREARLALRHGRCVGFLFDDTAIAADLGQGDWPGYEMALPPLDRVGWSIGVRREALATDFGALVAGTVADWHRSGTLIAREAAWGIAPTRFLAEMHDLWTARDAAGAFVCAAAAPAGAACTPPGLGETIAGPPRRKGAVEHWLETRGINLAVLFDPYDRSRFLAGIGWTVALALLCVLVSIGTGFAGALAMAAGLRPLRWASAALVAFFRHTPPLVQLYFFFFGIGALVPAIGGFVWAVVTLGLYAGASNAVLFGAGLASVPGNVVDAARALGYGALETQVRIVMPIALRNCLPAVNANLVNIVKATGLAGAIAVPELLNTTNSIWSQQGNTTEMMNLMLVIFFLLVSGVVYAAHLLEKRLRAPGGAA